MSKPYIRTKRKKSRPGRLKGEALTELRRQCFERDGYRCQQILARGTYASGATWEDKCNDFAAWETGHMAHIVSRGRGGKDELSNVTTKCAACHIGIEHAYGPSGVKPCPRKWRENNSVHPLRGKRDYDVADAYSYLCCDI